MDFWSTVLVLFKRWYIALPALLASLGIAALVYASVPVQYVSTSVLVLTTPTTGPTQQANANQASGITNPLLDFSQGLSLSASILIQALSTPETASSLGIGPNGQTSYTVTNGSTNPELLTTGPFVFITGESYDPLEAQDIVKRVADRASTELAQRQSELDAPPSTYITIHQVVSPTTPQAPKGTRLRAAGVVGVLSTVASLASVYAFESYATRPRRSQDMRSRRKSRPPTSEHQQRILASGGRSE